MAAIDSQFSFRHWLEQQLDNSIKIEPLAGDASFRQFFRVSAGDQCFIGMDSSGSDENRQAFSQVARLMQDSGLCAPRIIAEDLTQGFFLVSDLGDLRLCETLDATNCELYYRRAIDELVKLEQIATPQWPEFARNQWRWELEQFWHWFLIELLGLPLQAVDKIFWQQQFEKICDAMESQPRIPAHRDYHSKNLLVYGERIGIVDIQDACYAPLTYDLVSLLRDCYIDWPKAQVIKWLRYYQQQAEAAAIIARLPFAQLEQWFDITGIQRHLKAIFIFARKHCRDQNSAYLQYIPRALNYVLQVSANYPEFIALRQWLLDKVSLQLAKWGLT